MKRVSYTGMLDMIMHDGYDHMYYVYNRCSMKTAFYHSNVQEMFRELFHGQNGFTVQQNNF